MELEELQNKYDELTNENNRLKTRKGVRRKRRQNKRRTKE